MKLFITGGSGYVGAMLADQFAGREDVEAILLIDKEPYSELLKGHQNENKISFIQANLGNDGWQEKVKEFAPDVIVHAAWQIREMFGKKDVQWKWNITGSDHVFDLVFSLPSVKKLIYFSTVSSYAAESTNTIDHRFTEAEGFRKSDYLYAEEKRISEEHLRAKYDEALSSTGSEQATKPQVFIVRPAALTGPRGRYMRVRFGLQSALSGQLKETFIHKVISALVSVVPITLGWLRQYIHEDDVCNIVEMFAFTPVKGEYEVYNICPPGEAVLGPDMAKAVNKKALLIYPWMVRLAFFFFWNVTRGKVPTSKGGWKFYSYPVAVDGSKLTKETGYNYLYPSKDAFVKKEGRYAKYIK